MPAKSNIGTIAVALTASAGVLTSNVGILVQSDAQNTAGSYLYVGFAETVTAAAADLTSTTDDATVGIQLAVGQSYTIPAKLASDAANVYVIGSASGLRLIFKPI